MKFIKFFFAAYIALTFASCHSQQKEQGVPDNALSPDLIKNPATGSSSGSTNKNKAPIMAFETDTHDFGTITEGEKISYAFKFKNTGNEDLLIRSANGSCGCTVPEWPKEAIPAGKEGVIKVTFDSQGKQGMQHKTVTIISNTIPNNTIINITGEVVPAGK